MKSLIKISALFVFFCFTEVRLLGQVVNQISIEGDTSFCEGDSTVLFTNDFSSGYFWSNGDTSQSIVVKQEGVYYLKGYGLSRSGNLVVNGDFEAGDIGFTTDYVNGCASVGSMPRAGYCVSDITTQWYSTWADCSDHTTGSGKMFVTDCADRPNENLWCHSVNVLQNTDYDFSTWVTKLIDENDPLLQFSINGNPIGDPFEVNGAVCNWKQFSSTWNSQLSTTAEICIMNQNSIGDGNDLAIDDITFTVIDTIWTMDSVEVIVDLLPNFSLGNDTTICSDDIAGNYTLSVPLVGVEYFWEPDGEVTQSLLVSDNGDYSVVVTDSNLCVNRDTIKVEFQKNPIVDLGSDTAICAGNVLFKPTILYGNPNHYVWQDGATTQAYKAELTADYWVEVQEGNCKGSDTVHLTILDAAALELDSIYEICDKGSIRLQLNLNGNYLFNWNNLGFTNQNTFQASGGEVVVEVQDSNDCIVRDTTIIRTRNPLMIDLGPDVAMCSGEDYQISANRADVDVVSWNNDSSLQDYSLNVDQTGVYWIEVDSNGCSARDSIEIIVNEIPRVDLGRDSSLCEGEALSLKNIEAYTGISFLWNDQSVAETLTVESSGNYWLEIENNSCKNRDSIHVYFSDYPKSDLQEDTVVCFGEMERGLEIVAGADSNKYLWSDLSTSSIVQVLSAGMYSVEISNSFGCTIFDEIEVEEMCPSHLWIPNTFTPNGDGVNDLWEVKGDGVTDLRISVFSRWGNLIWEGEGEDASWDGRYILSNQTVQQDVYVYRISYETYDLENNLKTKVFNGTINLIR